MTDWVHDVDDLISLYDSPDGFTNDQVVDIVLRFLAHVPNHVAAAKKLVGLGPLRMFLTWASSSKTSTNVGARQVMFIRDDRQVTGFELVAGEGWTLRAKKIK